METTMKTCRVILATACVCTLGAATLPEDPHARVFDGADARDAQRAPDWHPGAWKAECALSQAIVGLSKSLKEGNAHAALCTPYVRAYRSTGEPRIVAFAGQDNRDVASPDWDQGFYKGECSAREVVVGVSQTLDHKMASLLCATTKAPLAHKDCVAEVFAGDKREPGASRLDWDAGYYKGECGAGRYVAGVSQDTKTGRPHAIYCCGR
jgi:hypothetical protein